MEPQSPDPTPNQSPTIAEPVPDIGTVPAPEKSGSAFAAFPFRLIGIGVGIIVLLIVVGVMAWTLLSRGSNQTPSSTTARPITLTYWGMWEQSETLTAIFRQFETQNPGVTIQYSPQSPKDYNDRLISACGRGQCPDLFRFHSTWTSQYVQRGLLAPMSTSAYTPAEFERTFYPVVATDLRTANGYAGVPMMYDGLGLYVNKKILQASGRSVPTTWDELRTLAKNLTIYNQTGGIDRAGIALGSSVNVDHFSDILAVLILQNGGNPAKPENFGSNSREGEGRASLVGDALTFYTQFVRADKVWDETMPNSTYAFAIERAAMIIAPAYRAAEIKKLNPNFTFEVYPLPQLPGKPITYANYWVEGVAKTSKEQEMAWRLLKYLSSKEVLQRLNPVGSGTVIKEVYPRADMAELLASDPYAGAIVRQAPSSQSFYMASRTFDKGLNDKMIAAYQELVTKLLKGGRYDELGEAFAPQIAQIVASYGIKP